MSVCNKSQNSMTMLFTALYVLPVYACLCPAFVQDKAGEFFCQAFFNDAQLQNCIFKRLMIWFCEFDAHEKRDSQVGGM